VPRVTLDHYPEYHKQKQVLLEVARKNAQQLQVIHDWFQKYQMAVEKYRIQLHDTYNIDETANPDLLPYLFE
jgi:hypothetical protein